MNDIQEHLLKKVREASDDLRSSSRELASDVVDSIVAGFAAGLTRAEVVDNLAAGFFAGGLR